MVSQRKEATGDVYTGLLDTARAARSAAINKALWKDVGRVAGLGVGIGAGARGLQGIWNLLRRNSPSTGSSAYAPLTIDIPSRREEEKEKFAAEKPGLLGQFFRGDFASGPGTHPYAMPATYLGGGAAVLGGWKLMDWLLDRRRKSDMQAELDKSEQEYDAALQSQFKTAGTLAADLDDLFDMVEKRGTWGDAFGVGAGMYMTGAGLAALLTGKVTYDIARKRQRNSILEKARRQNLRKSRALRPSTIYVNPLPERDKLRALPDEEEMNGSPLDKVASGEAKEAAASLPGESRYYASYAARNKSYFDRQKIVAQDKQRTGTRRQQSANQLMADRGYTYTSKGWTKNPSAISRYGKATPNLLPTTQPKSLVDGGKKKMNQQGIEAEATRQNLAAGWGVGGRSDTEMAAVQKEEQAQQTAATPVPAAEPAPNPIPPITPSPGVGQVASDRADMARDRLSMGGTPWAPGARDTGRNFGPSPAEAVPTPTQKQPTRLEDPTPTAAPEVTANPMPAGYATGDAGLMPKPPALDLANIDVPPPTPTTAANKPGAGPTIAPSFASRSPMPQPQGDPAVRDDRGLTIPTVPFDTGRASPMPLPQLTSAVAAPAQQAPLAAMPQKPVTQAPAMATTPAVQMPTRATSPVQAPSIAPNFQAAGQTPKAPGPSPLKSPTFSSKPLNISAGGPVKPLAANKGLQGIGKSKIKGPLG